MDGDQGRRGTGAAIAVEGDTWPCVTCGHEASGNYCENCGERRPELSRHALVHLVAEGLESLFHFDAKVLVTLRRLVTRPGALTVDYLVGRHRPYVGPLQLFLVCNLVFFVVQPLTRLNILAPPLDAQLHQPLYGRVAEYAATRHLASLHLTVPEFRARFYHATELQARSLVILMVPLFAVLVGAAELRAHRLFIECIVFALHVYGFWLLWLSLVLLLAGLTLLAAPAVGSYRLDTFLTIVEFAAFFAYVALGLRTVFGERGAAPWIKAVGLTIGAYYLLHVYRFILFFTTLYSA